jgi:hypothetical protein
MVGRRSRFLGVIPAHAGIHITKIIAPAEPIRHMDPRLRGDDE